jgi:hypothetical protein
MVLTQLSLELFTSCKAGVNENGTKKPAMQRASLQTLSRCSAQG